MVDLLTLDEAAKAMRLKISTLRAWRQQRRLPFVKLGGRVMLRRADIERFIEQSVIPAQKKAA